MPFQKLYLTTLSPQYTPATLRGAWDQTAGAVTKGLDPVHGGEAVTSVAIAETDATAEWDVLMYRGISPPLAAQTLQGDFNLIVGTYQSSGAADFCWHVHAFVIQGDSDSVRGTLISDYRELATHEWPNSGSSPAMAQGWNLVSSQAYNLAISAGDRIVVELGYASRNTTTTSRTGTLYYGQGNGNGDLAYQDPEVTGHSGILTFSNPITEQYERDLYTSQLVLETLIPRSVPGEITQMVLEYLIPTEMTPTGVGGSFLWID